MSTCERCGSDYRLEARFCGVCGNPITVPPAGRNVASGKAAAAPVVRSTDVDPASAASSTPRSTWLVPVALAVLGIVVGATIGLVLSGGGEDTTTATAAPSTEDGSDAGSDDGDNETTTGSGGRVDEDPSETTAPGADGPVIRAGTLYSNRARLRSGPDINSRVVTTLSRNGAPLQIVGRHQNGWYEVRMDGSQGWIFGAFVDPPPSGHRIIQSSGGNIVLRDDVGAPLGITNESGPKALATGAVGNLWQVILPDGRLAYVLRSDVFVAAG